ncbi:DUF1731 domain-containing protein [Nocardia yamanashiensis]|uniref:DUF1731 domain-containing protein n=1 Tax=Nocardia yamanashiensis TaxID=209247 RepID=UPI001E415429|nr:DUF1731 domain-containing protein [Nocardia yamanashiensis]UGT39040.1 DUF1731 domain-containing protein [Nocardia yamanashiensis]
MPRTTTYTQFIALPPERLWAVLGDPRRWPEWNPGVAAVDLRSEPAVDARGDYVPGGRVAGAVHRRFAKPFVITNFVPGRELGVEQPEPAGTMRLRWVLTPRDGGTELVQELTFAGPSAAVFRKVAGVNFQTDVHTAFTRLAQLAGLEPGTDALTVVIAGGSGALGRILAADLACRGHRVRILTRRKDDALPYEQFVWDGQTVGEWVGALRNPGPTALINLAGKLVDCRPTERNIAELRNSRVDSTRALVEASHTLDRPLDYWIQASTTAIWSDAGETRCTETTPLPVPGLPQMTGVASPWEKAFEGADTSHHTILRTSIVLDPDAPALKRLAALTKAGLGGSVGNGRQWFCWIHLDDWLAIVRAALGLDPRVSLPDGVVVAATDFPVRNRELMATLRRRLRRPWSPPTPAPALTIGAVFLRTDPALGLTGRYATSEVLRKAGFRFRYPTLDEALANLLPR